MRNNMKQYDIEYSSLKSDLLWKSLVEEFTIDGVLYAKEFWDYVNNQLQATINMPVVQDNSGIKVK